ncbi:MAG: hypothetical protein AAGE52_32610 [Myxococcota bacterium]
MRSALIAIAWFLVAASASAQDAPTNEADPADGAIVLRPSAQWGIVKGDRTSGFGLGLEYIAFPNQSYWNYGFFAETQGELDGAWRVAAGVRGGFGMFGVQLGVMHRTEGDYAATTAIHLAKTVTFGPVGVGWRVAIPVATYQPDQGERLQTRGFEAGIVLNFGWSFTVRGTRPAWGCHHRRGEAEASEAEPAPAAY